MAQTTTLRIQNLVNRGLEDQDRDWIIRIRCFKTPIAANQNSTYSFFKLDQPWLKQPHWGFETWSTVDWKIKIGIGLSEYGVSKHQLQLIKTLLLVFSNLTTVTQTTTLRISKHSLCFKTRQNCVSKHQNRLQLCCNKKWCFETLFFYSVYRP